ncbi:MAG: ABC transporter ATP-binding protein [Dehalococcoidia bacterium]
MFRIDIEQRVGDFHLRPAFEARGEFVVLFGPSGSGKSLTLQAVAGLLTPERGRIELPGGLVAFDASTKINVPPQQRNIGYVVQELALFPHMSARQNIEFGVAHWTKQRRRARADRLIAMLDLEGLADRRPRAMSGGQQQRVALARALAAEPSLLLLDEPFSALEAPLRSVLRRELATLRKRLDLTALLVTHDLNEAYGLADSIAVYDDGMVLQHGTRDAIFRRPSSRRVAELVEVRNIIPGAIGAYAEGVAVVRTPWFTARVHDAEAPVRGDVYLCIRPEHIIVLREGHEAHDPLDVVLDAEIIDETATANTHRLYMRTDVTGAEIGEPYVFEVDVPAHPYEVLGISSKREWRIALTSDHLTLISRDGASGG